MLDRMLWIFLIYAFGQNRSNRKSDTKRKDEHAQAPGYISHHQAKAHEYHHREDEKKFWKRSISWSIATFGVAIGAVIVAYLTFNDAHESLVAVQRAFVYFSDFKPIGAENSDGQNVWTIKPEWENSGNTPTVNMKISLMCIANIEDRTDPVRMELFKGYSDRVIGPKQKIAGGECTIGPYTLIDIIPQKVFFYIVSIAKYSDVFGGNHITESCGRLIGIAGDPNNFSSRISMTFEACKTHNCADQQCGMDQFSEPEPFENRFQRFIRHLKSN